MSHCPWYGISFFCPHCIFPFIPFILKTLSVMEILKNGENKTNQTQTNKQKWFIFKKTWGFFLLIYNYANTRRFMDCQIKCQSDSVLPFYPMCSLPISPSLAPFVWGESDCCFSGELSNAFLSSRSLTVLCVLHNQLSTSWQRAWSVSWIPKTTLSTNTLN